MVGSIIDVEKLQNEKFVKRNWLIMINGIDTTIILDKTEVEIFKTVNTFNAIGKLQKLHYTFKPIIVTYQDV